LLRREHHNEKNALAALVRLLEQDEAFCALSRSREDKGPNPSIGRSEGLTASQTILVPEWNSGSSIQPHEWANQPDAVRSANVESYPTDEFCDARQYRHDAEHLKRRRASIQASIVALLAVMGTAGAFGYFAWSGGRQLETVPSQPLPPLTTGVTYGVRSSAVLTPEGTDLPIAAGAQRVRSETVPATAPANLSAGDPFAPSASSASPTQTEEPLTGATSDQASSGLTVKSPAPEPDPPRGESDAAGGYLVQLSSQRSDEAAQTTAKALERKHSSMFDGRKPFIRRSDLGARGVYFRVLVGTFTRVDEANQFCSRLKKAGGDCLVQKN
jgi:hypothetical protein